MRNAISGFIALALIVVPTQFLNATSVKAGTSCTKLGQSQIFNGYKFTCIKSGKKLFWDKGIAIQKPSPTSSSSPTLLNSNNSSPKPQPTPTQTQTPIQSISQTGVPGNLRIAEDEDWVSLTWTAPESPSVQPEFYRIQGKCTLNAVTCGTFVYDLWEKSSSSELLTSYDIQKSSLINSTNGVIWTFSVSAGNQTKNIQGTFVEFDPVTFGQLKNLYLGTLDSKNITRELDSCSRLGERLQNTNGLFECRRIVGNKLVWISIHTSLPSEIKNPKSPDPISVCQIGDKRTSKLFNWPGIAFPATPAPGFSTKGTFKIIVVGIDFPDVKGAGKPSDIWKTDISKAKEWMDWYSSGQVKYDFVLDDKWLHESQISKTFDVFSESTVNGDQLEAGGLTPNQIATNYLNLIGSDTDITNTTAIWIYYPKTIKDITAQWTSQLAGPVKTDKYGTVNTDLIAVGQETYTSKTEIWRWFLHEMIHRHGVLGHSPKIPFLTGVMSTFNSWTDALLPWDSLVVDWQSDGDYYCVENNQISSPTELTLVPLEREQKGYKAVVIKLSESQVLIIDSHRRDKWSQDTMPGQYGVMMTLVDTTKNSDFTVGEDGNSPSTSIFLKVAGVDHGKHQFYPYGIHDSGFGIQNDLDTSGNNWSFDLNYLMYLGESNIFQNIKVSLIKSGDNDTVRIEKI